MAMPVCDVCGKTFTKTIKYRKRCSDVCQTKSFNQRHKNYNNLIYLKSKAYDKLVTDGKAEPITVAI